jgi:hypothetical protein
MNMVAHKTEAIYRRYAISDEKSLKEAGAKLAMLETGFDKVLARSDKV